MSDKSKIKTGYVYGFKNPALAALAFTKSVCSQPIDEQSFLDVAEKIPNENVDEGFVVDGYESLKRLCALGGFQIVCKSNQVFTCELVDKNLIDDCGCRFTYDEGNTVTLCDKCSEELYGKGGPYER